MVYWSHLLPLPLFRQTHDGSSRPLLKKTSLHLQNEIKTNFLQELLFFPEDSSCILIPDWASGTAECLSLPRRGGDTVFRSLFKDFQDAIYPHVSFYTEKTLGAIRLVVCLSISTKESLASAVTVCFGMRGHLSLFVYRQYEDSIAYWERNSTFLSLLFLFFKVSHHYT